MTAKEELKHRVERMSEEEAAAVLQRWRQREDRRILREGTISQLPPEERAAALRALFARYEAEGSYISDEEWEEFARDFDAQRPHRPLFS